VIEVLPASAGNRGEDRQLRKRLAARPDDVKLATAVARRYLEQARESEIRASPAWRWRRCAPGPTRTPRPTTCCSCARRSSSTCTSSMRPSGTCACCSRGRAASGIAGLADAGDGAARARPLRGVGRGLPQRRRRRDLPSACLAENAALRGETAPARRSFETLLAARGLPAATRGWLTTSLAELEERDARAAAADAAYRSVLKLGPTPTPRSRMPTS
jgi:hypothetical protein